MQDKNVYIGIWEIIALALLLWKSTCQQDTNRVKSTQTILGILSVSRKYVFAFCHDVYNDLFCDTDTEDKCH